mgnify:CR=1 FL=1
MIPDDLDPLEQHLLAAIEILEPLQKLRVTVDGEGLKAELTFTGRAFPIEEPRFIHRIGPRTFMDYTRLTQNGHYTGWIEIDPVLSLDTLFDVLSKPEIGAAFQLSLPEQSARKADQLAALQKQAQDIRARLLGAGESRTRHPHLGRAHRARTPLDGSAHVRRRATRNRRLAAHGRHLGRLRPAAMGGIGRRELPRQRPGRDARHADR